MKSLLTGILWLFIGTVAFAAKPKNSYIKINTSQGECIIKLYNETPKHRDNFIKLAKDGVLNQTLFHRVIKDFMIQGGDPDSKNAKPGQLLGGGSLNYTIPAEFNPDLFHKKGALAAARDNNPSKASNASQFYLVQGKAYTDVELDRIEQHYLNGAKIPENQRQIYKTLGGAPFLDRSYTVFGEIVRGIQMVDTIAVLPVDSNNRPLTDVTMKVSLLKNRDVKKLEKTLLHEVFKKTLIMKKQ